MKKILERTGVVVDAILSEPLGAIVHYLYKMYQDQRPLDVWGADFPDGLKAYMNVDTGAGIFCASEVMVC